MSAARRGLVLAWIAAACAPGAGAAAGITRTVVEQHPIAGTGRVLELILIEFPPGAQAPPHLHPATGLNYILSGEAESQYEGEPLRRYRAGDSYQDPPGRKHLVFRNASASEPLRFLVAAELGQGEAFSQPLP